MSQEDLFLRICKRNLFPQLLYRLLGHMPERLTFIVHKYMMIIGDSFPPAKIIVTLCEIKSSAYSITSHYKSQHQTYKIKDLRIS